MQRMGSSVRLLRQLGLLDSLSIDSFSSRHNGHSVAPAWRGCELRRISHFMSGVGLSEVIFSPISHTCWERAVEFLSLWCLKL